MSMFPTMTKRIEVWRDRAEQLSAEIGAAHADYYRACGMEPVGQDRLVLRMLGDAASTASATWRHCFRACEICRPDAEQAGRE